MRIYEVKIVISGNNDKPEIRAERIISGDWGEVHEIMARICRDTGCVILEMRIIKTNETPFDYRSVNAT